MKKYQILADKKKAQQLNKIPPHWQIPKEKYQNVANVMNFPRTCGLLNETELKITSDYDATTLLAELKTGTWSVERVTSAFCKRAAVAHQLTNCLTEIFFDEAMQRARELDRQYSNKSDKTALPPLFGLPISLKDNFNIAGHDASTGLGCFVDDVAKENSAMAALLLDLGAVLYCKTNVPQSIMTADTDNNIFGRTLNPRNKQLNVGGSTGGEGALLALRGSVLGVGTDVGGSIRIPSVCNGLYGFRPSTGLTPYGGVRDLTPPGAQVIRAAVGPLAHSLRDCSLFLRTILQAEVWKYDSACLSVPWVDRKPKSKLRIGVAENDGFCTAVPPVRRVFKKAIDSLRGRSDMELIPISLPDAARCYQGIMGCLTVPGDFYSELFARTEEPVVPSLQNTGLLSIPGTTLQGLFDLKVHRAEAAETYRKLFRDNDLDAIFMPSAPHTAIPLDSWLTPSYTALWSYLDYPVIVIPVDQVRDVDVVDDLSNAKFGSFDESTYRLYTGPEQYKDAPVSVQVIGYKQKDEALLRVAEVLDSIVNKQEVQ